MCIGAFGGQSLLCLCDWLLHGVHNSGNYTCVVSTLPTEPYSKSHIFILKIHFGNCKMVSKQMNSAKLMNWVLPGNSHGGRRDPTSANVIGLPHTCCGLVGLV